MKQREEELEVKDGFKSFERLESLQFWTVPEAYKALRTKYVIQNDLSSEKSDLANYIFTTVKIIVPCF